MSTSSDQADGATVIQAEKMLCATGSLVFGLMTGMSHTLHRLARTAGLQQSISAQAWACMT